MQAVPKALIEESDLGSPKYLERIRRLLGGERDYLSSPAAWLPFGCDDTTGGAENEFQTAVVGGRGNVDLPLTIESSSFYRNMVRRTRTGDAPRRVIADLDGYLSASRHEAWENSWVRFPGKVLHRRTRDVMMRDLLADKTDPSGGMRGDMDRFLYYQGGEEWIRVPVSYLLKLSLAEALSDGADGHPALTSLGVRLMDHFLNDNTSPEVYSFQPVPLSFARGVGNALARETSKRFLFVQFLTMYGNGKFELSNLGQKVVVYCSPHPPVRQKVLNELVSDAFYRDLFMNPSLSGWDRGEAKYEYMILCHQVLSRSQLNTLWKLRESGIITRNLVVLPNLSNISLANNGTHVSIGSLRLKGLLEDRGSGFMARDEKYLGDLAIKIVEHFLPLFVGTYSAAPYRLDFRDFHPEKVLGFLPHELDYTHLRMLWRRWKKKADLRIFGQPVTPFGPRLIDRAISSLFRLRGDFVQDFRLVDYLVALMSTDQSPALDGTLGNDLRLKADLFNMGIFDEQMALYLLYRLREHGKVGYSGFEGRHYSLFESFLGDMGPAVSLQVLLTALAYKYILTGEVTHGHIPDEPTIESDRRQIVFGTAIGIPTFYVRRDTRNLFLKRILEGTEKTRVSRRYPGYVRVYNDCYRKALLDVLTRDGGDVIDLLGLSGTVEDLRQRIEEPDTYSVAARITKSTLNGGRSRNPMKLSGDEYNEAAEKYYRDGLRKLYMEEGLSILEDDFRRLDSHAICSDCLIKDVLHRTMGGGSAWAFLKRHRREILEGTAPPAVLRTLIHLTVLTVHEDGKETELHMVHGSRS